jgi:hypothetical protein
MFVSQPMPQGGQSSNLMQQNKSFGVNPTNYKRDICKYYESGRQCPYQNRCSFAHGNNDIRTQPVMNMSHMGGMPNQMQPSRGPPGNQMAPQMQGQMVGMPGQMQHVMYPNNPMFQQDWQIPQMAQSQ